MPEEQHCPSHSGNTERINALEEKINSRLNLMIGLLASLIMLIVGSVGWAYGSMGHQDKVIQRLSFIQETVLKRLDKMDDWCVRHDQVEARK